MSNCNDLSVTLVEVRSHWKILSKETAVMQVISKEKHSSHGEG
jgi:hypothetical protein